jgi:hypothetical protein
MFWLQWYAWCWVTAHIFHYFIFYGLEHFAQYTIPLNFWYLKNTLVWSWAWQIHAAVLTPPDWVVLFTLWIFIVCLKYASSPLVTCSRRKVGLHTFCFCKHADMVEKVPRYKITLMLSGYPNSWTYWFTGTVYTGKRQERATAPSKIVSYHNTCVTSGGGVVGILQSLLAFSTDKHMHFRVFQFSFDQHKYSKVTSNLNLVVRSHRRK